MLKTARDFNDIEDKFVSLAICGGKTRKKAELIINQVWQLEEGLSGLLRALQ